VHLDYVFQLRPHKAALLVISHIHPVYVYLSQAHYLVYTHMGILQPL
jgi:hypothetical protein